MFNVFYLKQEEPLATLILLAMKETALNLRTLALCVLIVFWIEFFLFEIACIIGLMIKCKFVFSLCDSKKCVQTRHKICHVKIRRC